MQDTGRIPRWIVENDPSWEKSFDSNPQIQKWIKKGTNIEAICTSTSISCEIIGEITDDIDELLNPLSIFLTWNKRDILSGGDLTKYLSSRYLNSKISRSPSFDITKTKLLK
jgi:hypothetical protein